MSFLPQRSALYSWEVASICSGMWSVLGWSLMALCQLPGQFSILKQCTIWGVPWPGHQTGCSAALQTALHPRSILQSLGWNLILLWGWDPPRQREKIWPSHFSIVKDLQLQSRKAATAEALSHYFLKEKGKAGIRTAFLKLPSMSTNNMQPIFLIYKTIV